jgi:LPXTG-site transpeptidase (sortase) family protein
MNLPKNIFNKKPLLPLLIVCILTIALLFYFVPKILHKKPSTRPAATVTNIQEEIVQGLPTNLKIPSINVDANVLSVGLTPAGAMDTPKGPSDVAWFNLGKRPGESGSAVITGHYGTWKTGGGSVFDNLNKLSKGDKLYVTADDGTTTTFVVRETRNYDPKADATNVFSSDDDNSHLNLITCEGTWNKDSKSYSQRLVVFTDKE